MKNKIKIFFTIFLLFLNIIFWQEVFKLENSHNLEINFLDVGQGDSIFIQSPQNHQILIDGGPDYSIMQKLSERMSFWDKTLDLVILSHPESDHMQGLVEALKYYKADYILWSGIEKDTPEYYKWINVLKNQEKEGTKILIAKLGEEIKAGNIKIEIIHPFDSLEKKEFKNSANDTSVVLKLIYGENSFIFTGDISSKTEEKIIDYKPNLNLDVLKVAHHGSKYSTSELFLSVVQPKIAIISVGFKNIYGHPTDDVLQRLKKFGIKIGRTDVNGDIKLISNGKNIIIK